MWPYKELISVSGRAGVPERFHFGTSEDRVGPSALSTNAGPIPMFLDGVLPTGNQRSHTTGKDAADVTSRDKPAA